MGSADEGDVAVIDNTTENQILMLLQDGEEQPTDYLYLNIEDKDELTIRQRLKRLVEQQMIRLTKQEKREPGMRGRPMNYYRITKKGEKRVSAMLAEVADFNRIYMGPLS